MTYVALILLLTRMQAMMFQDANILKLDNEDLVKAEIKKTLMLCLMIYFL